MLRMVARVIRMIIRINIIVARTVMMVIRMVSLRVKMRMADRPLLYSHFVENNGHYVSIVKVATVL